MDCRNIQRVIYRYIYDESDERELKAVKAHLDKCQQCQEEAATIDSILKRLKSEAKQDPVPEGSRDRILKEIHRRAG